MGGNGARSATRIAGARTVWARASARNIGGGPGAGAVPGPTQQQPVQQQPVNGQATQPSLTLDQFQQMNATALVNYLRGLGSNVTMPGIEELPECDTQRLIYDLGLNGQPQVMKDSDFQKLSGTTMYRGVHDLTDGHGTIIATSDGVVNDTLYGQYSRIGAGMYGDGYYFGGRSTASSYAGGGRDARVMQMKLDTSRARTISYSSLQRMYRNESSAVRNAISRMSVVNNDWPGEGGMAAYALYKGYNVITEPGRGFVIPIDRSVMIMSDKTFRK